MSEPVENTQRLRVRRYNTILDTDAKNIGLHFGSNSYGRDKNKIYLFIILSAISCPGFFNVVFAGTPLVGWKQILIFSLAVACYFSIYDKFGKIIFYVITCAAFLLVVRSWGEGLSFQDIIFSLYFYISWLPFYIFSKYVRFKNISIFIIITSFGIILVSVIGLYLQLFTPFLDFLQTDIESIVYSKITDNAQRQAFIFVASTLVLPTLAGFLAIISLFSTNNLLLFPSLACLYFAVIPTGSLGALFVVISCTGLTLFKTKFSHQLSVTLFIFILLLVTLPVLKDNATILTQIDRIFSNDSNSDSNEGRFILWSYAIDTISKFDVMEHFLGVGLGQTYGPGFGLSRYFHGESSWFQAYIEGGILGLLLRFTPFILLIFHSVQNRKNSVQIIYATGIFFACSFAPLFGAFGIQCILGFVAGTIGNRTRSVRHLKNYSRLDFPTPRGFASEICEDFKRAGTDLR